MILSRKQRFFIGFMLVAWIMVPALSVFAEAIQYTYDDLDRLTRAEYEDGTVIEYSYDKAGNRLTKQITAISSPEILTVIPTSGPTAGGTSVSITGSGFGNPQGMGSVIFDGVAAASYTSWTDTEIVWTTPAHAAGTVDVTVTADNGSNGTKSSAFTYTLSPQALIVTTTDDELNNDGDCSLREALEAANTDTAVDACGSGSGDDTIEFASGLTGTIILNGTQLTITTDVTIDGPGAETITISGNNASRVFLISGASTTVAISGLTIQDGSADVGGGLYVDAATLTLTESRVSENTSTINNVNFGGGGLGNINGTVVVNTCTFSGNTAVRGWDLYPAGNVDGDPEHSEPEQQHILWWRTVSPARGNRHPDAEHGEWQHDGWVDRHWRWWRDLCL